MLPDVHVPDREQGGCRQLDRSVHEVREGEAPEGSFSKGVFDKFHEDLLQGTDMVPRTNCVKGSSSPTSLDEELYEDIGEPMSQEIPKRKEEMVGDRFHLEIGDQHPLFNGVHKMRGYEHDDRFLVIDKDLFRKMTESKYQYLEFARKVETMFRDLGGYDRHRTRDWLLEEQQKEPTMYTGKKRKFGMSVNLDEETVVIPEFKEFILNNAEVLLKGVVEDLMSDIGGWRILMHCEFFFELRFRKDFSCSFFTCPKYPNSIRH
jgi:hypothetical protein